MIAVLSPDGLTFTLRGVRWVRVLPVAALPGQLRFYRDLWSRGARVKGQAGPQARHYAPMVEALEVLAAELAGKGAAA